MKIRSILLLTTFGLSLTACNSGTSSDVSSNSQAQSSQATVKYSTSASNTSISSNLNGYSVVSSAESNGILYAGTDSGLFISSDSGQTWDLKTTDNGLSSNKITALAVNGSTVYAISGGYADVSTDGGQTWKQLQTTYAGAYIGVAFSNGLIYLLANFGNAGVLQTNFLTVSSDNGKTWSSVTLYKDVVKLTALYVDNGTIYYIDSWTSMVYKTSDLGKSYNYTGLVTSKGEIPYLHDVAASGNYVAVGTDHGVAATTTTGLWSSSSFKISDIGLANKDVKKVAVDNHGKIFATTSNGLAISDDAGSTFGNYTGIKNELPSSNIMSVSANSNSLLVGTDNGIQVYNNIDKLNYANDATESNVNTLLDSNIMTGYAFSGWYGNGLKINTESIQRTIKYTGTTSGISDDYVTSFAMESSNLYVGSLGGLSISHDNGNSWTFKDASNGMPGYVYTVAVTGNNIYAGTYGSGLLISHDGGNTWKTVHLSGDDDIIHSVVVDGTNVYAGTYNGGVSISNDSGNSWKHYLDDTSILSVVVAGSKIYAAANDGVYISTNSGQSWVKKTNNISGTISTMYVSVGNIYLGFEDGSTAISVDGGNKFTRYQPATDSADAISSIYQKNGIVIIGGAHGLMAVSN